MKNTTESFLTSEEHLALLVQSLDPEPRAVYGRTKNAREEVGYRGRSFIVYEITGRNGEHNVLDTLTVRDFECDDVIGASFVIQSQNTGLTLEVGHKPVQLWQFPVFLYLPLHLKLRWSTHAGNLDSGSLGFPIKVRTLSRLDLREKGVTYCETGVSYAQEFIGITK